MAQGSLPHQTHAFRRQDGQAVVEFALIMPVLLLLLLGILKFGLLYNNYITLTDAVRVGSRQLALGRGLTDPCTPAIARTISAAKPSLNLTSAQVTVTLLTPDTCGTPISGGYHGRKPGAGRRGEDLGQLPLQPRHLR